MKNVQRWFPMVILVAAVSMTAPAWAKNKSKIKGALENSGVEPAAGASMRALFAGAKSKLQIKLQDLSPATTYSFFVGAVERAQFTTSNSGSAKLRFQNPPKGSSLPLDFDPRGQQLTVDAGATQILEIVLSGAGEPAGLFVDERTDLAPTALAAGGKAEARFRMKKDGRTTFKAEIEDVPNGSYDLFVDGVLRGSIAVSLGQGQIEFDSAASPPKLPLDFDPRGLIVDVAQGSDVFFSGEMTAQANGVTNCTFSESEIPVTSTGVDPDASAKSRFRVRGDCDQDFRIEIEDVPVGSYDLLVGGVLRGLIVVVDDGVKVEGEIEFDSDPDDPGEVLLNFDPRGQTIEVVQGATTYFSDTFNPSTGGGSSCTEEETNQAIASTGVDPDGDAEARFRLRDDCDQDFQVEIEDVPVGDYDLIIDGVFRGVITVVDDGVKIEGRIEFDTDADDPDELPLTFDPNGGSVEVVQGATVFFSDTFGSGGGGGPTVCEPQESEVPLLNNGPAGQSKGKARLRLRDDCDEDFRVEIEDLPLGNYDVVVGGVTRGSITVADIGGEVEGEIEFDSDPDDPDEVLLDFDPRGQLVEIVQSATTYLARTFPTN